MKETRIQSLAEISHFTHRKNRQAHTALLRRVLKFINHQSIYYSINNGLWLGWDFLRGALPLYSARRPSNRSPYRREWEIELTYAAHGPHMNTKEVQTDKKFMFFYNKISDNDGNTTIISKEILNTYEAETRGSNILSKKQIQRLCANWYPVETL